MSPGSRSPAEPALERAVAAARTGDLGAARDALIAAWRARRSPVLAELVAVLDARVPDATSAAIAAIVTPRVASSLANLEALAAVVDPRLSAFAIDALHHLPFTGDSARDFLTALVAVASRHHDPRLASNTAPIRAAIVTRIGRLALRNDLVDGVLLATRACPPVPPATDAELAREAELRSLVEPLRKASRSAESLLADVYAHPGDDTPRQVYADLLLEQEDPRGELIVLQLERERTGAEPSAREIELLKKHGKAWLGALAPVASWGKGYSRTRFRRGFPSHMDIILSVGKKLAPILESPVWATIESFESAIPPDVLARAPLRALLEISTGPGELLDFARRPELLTSVRRVALSAPASLTALRGAFPNVDTVIGTDRTITRELVERYVAIGVERVELVSYYAHAALLPAALAAFDAMLAEVGEIPATCAQLHLFAPFDRWPRPPAVEFHRDANGRFRRYTS